MPFRNDLGKRIFELRYQNYAGWSWQDNARTLVHEVCGGILSNWECSALEHYIGEMMFLPGGRYNYYAGRLARFWNNCFLLRALQDTREEWGELIERSTKCLMTGGGIGSDYSRLRGRGSKLSRTGGEASGPIPLMKAIDSVGAQVRQGGNRRSAIYASLDWNHPDIEEFLNAKDWDNQPLAGTTVGAIKKEDFSFHAPLEFTNISVNYNGTDYPTPAKPDLWDVFVKNVGMAMRNGEPGFSFNFGTRLNETLRNACTEVTSEDDSDCCNLGSINLSRIPSRDTLAEVSYLASKFLYCGTIRGEVPTPEIARVRDQNRRLGLGIMGVHEWLLRRGKRYEPDQELGSWLGVWRDSSEDGANELADRLSLPRPVRYRAVAPTGTIGMLAGTSTGIEPVFAVAYRRRYFANEKRVSKYEIDAGAQVIINETGVDPDSIESSLSLAEDPERRIAFQAWAQRYVDMAISSTLNLPSWGSELNNEDRVEEMARIVSKYASQLRGLTFYPDGSRGGQPLTRVPYAEAIAAGNAEVEDNSERACKEGVCGI